jgi:hypothetical protein
MPFKVANLLQNTGWNDEGGGNTAYLDRHNISCNTGALNNLKLVRRRDAQGNADGNYRYDYACTTGGYLGNTEAKTTQWHDEGAGNTIYLDRLDVDCGINNLISGLRLVRNIDAQGKAIGTHQYQYKCAPSSKALKCRRVSTVADSEGAGNAIYLDRHNIKCEDNEALSRLKLVRVGDAQGMPNGNYRYDYTCCSSKDTPILDKIPADINYVPGWAGDQNIDSNLPGDPNLTPEDCRQKALNSSVKYVAWFHRNSNHPNPNYKNTCSLYTSFSPYAGNPADTTHLTGCLNPGEKVADGCKPGLPANIDKVSGWFQGGTYEHPPEINQTPEDCRKKALNSGGKYVAWGHRNSNHSDTNLRNTCFLSTKFGAYSGDPSDTTHLTGCLNPGVKVADGCKTVLPANIDKVSGWFQGGTHENQPEINQTPEDCRQKALNSGGKYVAWGHRNSKLPEPHTNLHNTCFLYTKFGAYSGDPSDIYHTTGCLNPGLKVIDGCKAGLPTDIDKVRGYTESNLVFSPDKNQTPEDCRQKAISGKYVAWGHRNLGHSDVNAHNTCFFYPQGPGPYSGNPMDATHLTGCLNPGLKVIDGCKAGLTTK